MQALFLGKCDDPTKIAESKSSWDLLGRFNNYIDGIIADDKILALKIICVIIIATVFLANFFAISLSVLWKIYVCIRYLTYVKRFLIT